MAVVRGGRTDEAHDLLDEVLLVDEALALGVVLVAKVLRGLGGVVIGGVVLLVLLLRVLGALLGILRRKYTSIALLVMYINYTTLLYYKTHYSSLAFLIDLAAALRARWRLARRCAMNHRIISRSI